MRVTQVDRAARRTPRRLANAVQVPRVRPVSWAVSTRVRENPNEAYECGLAGEFDPGGKFVAHPAHGFDQLGRFRVHLDFFPQLRHQDVNTAVER